MAPTAYVAEDGLVSHQWDERSLSCEGSMLQSRGIPGPGSRNGWICEQEEEGGDRGFSEGKLGKGIVFET